MLIVGLGNPGKEYAGNRHNAGFMAIDALAEHYGFPEAGSKFHGDWQKGQIDGVKVFLLKPMTYMNKSGIAVQAAMKFFKIPPSKVLVIHDELDLPLGKSRVKVNGGAGGHNGIRDIDRHIGKEYQRLRIGIDHPGDADKVHDYVLSDFGKRERETLDAHIHTLVKHMPLLVKGDAANFMNKVALSP